jgi:type IV secretion system protein VirB4
VGCQAGRAPGETLSADDAARIKDAVDANYDQAPNLRRLRFFAELFKGARRPDAADLAARLAPGTGRASTPGCSTTPTDAWTSTPPPWAST